MNLPDRLRENTYNGHYNGPLNHEAADELERLMAVEENCKPIYVDNWREKCSQCKNLLPKDRCARAILGSTFYIHAEIVRSRGILGKCGPSAVLFYPKEAP